MRPIVAFVPCRSGSERVPHKNTRAFAGSRGGLVGRKLLQLQQVEEIDEIVVSTDDPKVMDIATAVLATGTKPFEILERPGHLATAQTSTDELIAHVPEILSEGLVLWTHVTSPFCDEAVYRRALAAYREGVEISGEYDSVMSVTAVRAFLWNRTGPVNYDRQVETWPHTQDLEPLFEVNSAVFLADLGIYTEHRDRIGEHPFFLELDALAAFDIDWPHDFDLAQQMALATETENADVVGVG